MCGKTTTQKSKTSSSSYQIWHKHPEILNKWLCGKCYANWLFEPKRKFKTRERLKQLEKNGILERKAYNEIPPRVEYRLTRKGVESVVGWMHKWSKFD